MFDDQILIDEAIQKNSIDAQWFLPFTLYRLQQYTETQEILLTVSLDIVLSEPTSKKLLLSWNTDTPRIVSPPVQETVITEWAACGIACVVLPLYTQFQLVKVTESGDRFDYWVGDGNYLFGLEISGLLQGRIETRKQSKVRQLLDNPFGVGGYVCIVHFGQQQVSLSFHR